MRALDTGSVGYGLILIASVSGLLAIVSDANPLVRFLFVCFPGVLGYAFVESARTGL
jgi:hypothetical protein